MKKILTVNIGSASKKYAVYDGENRIFSAHFEHGDKGGFLLSIDVRGTKEERSILSEDYERTFSQTVALLAEKEVADKNDISIAVRIVAPGVYFAQHRIIDDIYMKKLEEALALAPLHVESVLSEIRSIKEALPGVKMAGISDSAFHSTIPAIARNYALPLEDVRKYEIYRYGYHGLSAASVMKKIEEISGEAPKKAVICHLGSGASVTAIEKGKSVDNSMGFTPLEGLPMGTRSGTVDNEVVLLLQKKLTLSADEMSDYLNKKSGLLALGGSADIRRLLALEETKDEGAKLALDLFCYKVKQYIGAYTAAMGGVDTVIFSGTAGERSPILRERICEKLEGIGLILDKGENNGYTGDKEGFIDDDSDISVAVIKDDEAGEMARETAKLPGID